MAEPPQPRPVRDDDATIVSRPGRNQELVPGAVLGNTYRIEALVGRGSMGTVYRATHIELGTAHAIKVLLPTQAENPAMVRHLVDEGRKLAQLRHDAIVEYQGLLRDARGLRCLVMELVDGPSLTTLLKARRLEPGEVLRLRDRLAAGLAAAHDKGIVHRDVCPDNIILPRGDIGAAKLIDFGVAKALDPEATMIAGGFAAKLAYVSPEQLGLFGGQVDLRSDIYSLGLVLASAAIGFGKTLDMGTSLAAMLTKREHPPDLAPVPADLRAAIAPMLMPRPEDRPPSMRALLPSGLPAGPELAYRAAAAAAPAVAAPPAQRGNGAIVATASATLLVATALALVFVFRSTLWPPTVAALRANLATATSSYKCASITAQAAADRSVAVSGHVASAADLARLRRAVRGIYGVGPVTFDVHELAWPYCQIVDLLHPYTSQDALAAPRVALAGGAAYTGERLALAITMPDFDGYLLVDYFVKQGQVLHLLPNARDRLNIRPARNRFVLGRPPTLTCWTLADNPGDQMVTVIASSKPLFAGPLPDVENADAYLKALTRRLGAAGRIGAATLTFELQPPPYPNPAAQCPGS